MQTTAVAPSKPQFSIPSIIAVVAAIASFFVSAGTGLILAIVAIISGIIGFLLALAPSVRGGLTSMFSLVLAAIGIIAAIIKAVL